MKKGKAAYCLMLFRAQILLISIYENNNWIPVNNFKGWYAYNLLKNLDKKKT